MEERFILQLVRRYRKLFEEHGVPKRMWPDGDRCPDNEDDVLADAHALLDDVERFAHEAFEKRPRLHRGSRHFEDLAVQNEIMGDALYRLGWVQHALWMAGYRTTRQILEDNRGEPLLRIRTPQVTSSWGELRIGDGDFDD